MSVVWIASYPKSGNTWVRFLVANYLIGPVQDSAQVEQLIPYADQALPVATPGRRLIKTHQTFDGPLGRHLTDRSIYVVRHPKDVLLSNLNYKRLIMGKRFQCTAALYAREFIALGGDRQWIERGFGTLEQHAESWLGRHPHPRLLVRYEDLKADVAGQARTILEFLGHPPEDQRLAQAVSGSTFEKMRAMEVQERGGRRQVTSFTLAPLTPAAGKPAYFMNEGTSRGSLGHIDPTLDETFDRRFAGLMRLLGYAGIGARAAG